VLDNPIRFNDPTGRDIQCPIDGDCYETCDYNCAPPVNSSGGAGGNNGGSGGSFEPNIPDPFYGDGCEETSADLCIDENDDPTIQIAHTIYGEGGSLSSDAAANVLQVAINRAYVYWTCWEMGCSHSSINGNSKIPWASITTDQLKRLLLYVLSEPYGSEAAFNAWTEPYPHHGSFWPDVVIAVETILDNPGIHPSQTAIQVGNSSPASEIRSNQNVLYYVSSGDPMWRPSSPYVHTDALPSWPPGSAVRWQYYGIYVMNDN
jgi:hypothetical protein